MATYTKSTKYKGVAQRKNGTWFYRVKIIPIQGHGKVESDKPVYLQKSGFPTEDAANRAKVQAIRDLKHSVGDAGYTPSDILLEKEYNPRTFEQAFNDFLTQYIESESSRKKYRSLYNSQLTMWANKDIRDLKDEDIDLLLLSMALKGYKPTYSSSVRKMLKLFFDWENLIDPMVGAEMAQGITTKPYKLRLLSLFSGIGAPERALENLGIEYELVNFCEIEPNAIKAYCLLHRLDYEIERDPSNNGKKNLGDISKVNPNQLPDFDLMFFGSPCQQFSREGTRKGLYDENGNLTASGLIKFALDIAEEKQPKFLIIENVEGLLDTGEKEYFDEIYNRVHQIGYLTYSRVLDSRDFGIPQSRRRLFCVGVRKDIPVRFKFPKGNLRGTKSVKDFLDKTPPSYVYTTQDQYDRYVVQEGHKPSIYDLTEDISAEKDYIHTLKTKGGTKGHSNQNFVRDNKGLRCLSSNELMLFQGFQSGEGEMLFEHGIARTNIAKLAGNSITVPVVQAVFKSLFEQLIQDLRLDYKNDYSIALTDKNGFIMPFVAYEGNKEKLLPKLFEYFPKDLRKMDFVDLFAGAATVSVNVNARKIYINEFDSFLTTIYEAMTVLPPEQIWADVQDVIAHFDLSAYDKEAIKMFRAEYNALSKEERTKRMLYADSLALIYHSYNSGSHISFNAQGGFNSSAGVPKKGKSKINVERMGERFFPFAARLFYGGEYDYKSSSDYVFMYDYLIDGTLEEMNDYIISNLDFRDFDFSTLNPQNTFVYLDPPYINGTAAYNKYWTEADEHSLYALLDDLHRQGFRWMLSNTADNKGKSNDILKKWIAENSDRYIVKHLDRDYANAFSGGSGKKGTTDEVIVFNYQEE